MQAKQMIFIEYLDLYSINCRKFEEERFMLGTIFTQSLSGRSNFEEDHVAKRFTVVPDNDVYENQMEIKASQKPPVIVVKDNAWLLGAFQSSFHNLFSDICRKLTSFDLMAQKNHLVWLDSPVSDKRLLFGRPGHPQHLLALDLGLHDSLED